MEEHFAPVVPYRVVFGILGEELGGALEGFGGELLFCKLNGICQMRSLVEHVEYVL